MYSFSSQRWFTARISKCVKMQTYWIQIPSAGENLGKCCCKVQKLSSQDLLFVMDTVDWPPKTFLTFPFLIAPDFIWVATSLFFQNTFNPPLTSGAVPGWFKQSMGSTAGMWPTPSHQGWSQDPLECRDINLYVSPELNRNPTTPMPVSAIFKTWREPDLERTWDFGATTGLLYQTITEIYCLWMLWYIKL